jgi:hypothetical protein
MMTKNRAQHFFAALGGPLCISLCLVYFLSFSPDGIIRGLGRIIPTILIVGFVLGIVSQQCRTNIWLTLLISSVSWLLGIVVAVELITTTSWNDILAIALGTCASLLTGVTLLSAPTLLKRIKKH